MSDKSPLTHFAGGGDQNHPQEKEMQKGKQLSDGQTNGCLALQIAEKREAKGKGEKERYIHLNAEQNIPKNSKERQGSLPQ